MKRKYKILISIGFFLLLPGFFSIYVNIPYHRVIYIDNFLLNLVLFFFWYIEPVIGIVLLIALRKRKEKYIGLLFLLIWIFAAGLEAYWYQH